MDTKKQKKPLLIIICILSALLVLGLVLGLTVFSKFRMYTIFSNRGCDGTGKEVIQIIQNIEKQDVNINWHPVFLL